MPTPDATTANIGRILTDPTLQRDAVHIAVVPVIAAQSLQPGWHIGLRPDGKAALSGEDDIEAIGIVDPYLREAVATSERFFLFLYPGTITSLKHLWTHPAFDAQDRAQAEHSLEQVAYDIRTHNANAIPPVVEAPPHAERAMILTDRNRAGMILRDVAARAGTAFEDLMRAAEQDRGDGYLILGTDNEIYDVPPEFWPAWSIYTGQRIPLGAAEHFSCSC